MITKFKPDLFLTQSHTITATALAVPSPRRYAVTIPRDSPTTVLVL